jgi:hypothetical protein
MNKTLFFTKLVSFKDGVYKVMYQKRVYLLHKKSLFSNKIIKLYAKELRGNDIVSGNYYPTIKNGTLKPCEMSEQKVVDFVLNTKVL